MNAPPASNTPGRRGRPRAFDTTKALEQAMRLFWQKGYDGTSLSDLTDAMGINRPSMYAAFGNKESLFRKAVDHYIAHARRAIQEALDLPTAGDVAERMLMLNLCDRKPRGCMLVQSALVCSAAAEKIKKLVAARRGDVETLLTARFQRAIDENDLPKTANAGLLAKYIVTIGNGMSVQAAGGAKPDELLGVVRQAMQAFPKKARKRD